MHQSIPERKDTDPRFHWHIEDYFKTDAGWEAAFSALEAAIPEMAEFSGKLADSAETLLSCLIKNEELSLKLDHVYTYANMRMHEDSANAFYQGMASRAEMLLIRYSAAISFLTPEIIAIPEEKLAAFREEKNADFAIYDHFFHLLIASLYVSRCAISTLILLGSMQMLHYVTTLQNYLSKISGCC